MANKTMKTLTIGGNTYEIVDEVARNLIGDEAVSTQITNAVDDIQIGGRNLLRGTQYWDSAYWSYIGNQTVSGETVLVDASALTGESEYRQTYQGINLQANKTYTLSVDLLNAQPGMCGVWITDQTAMKRYYAIHLPASTASEVKRYSGTFTVPEGSSIFRVYIRAEAGSLIQVQHIQLEEGNKATAWKPALEDITPSAIGAAASDHIHNTLINSDGTKLRVSLNSEKPIIWGIKDDKNVWSLERSSLTDDKMMVYYYNTDGSPKYGRTLLDSGNYKTYATPANIGASPTEHVHDYLQDTTNNTTLKVGINNYNPLISGCLNGQAMWAIGGNDGNADQLQFHTYTDGIITNSYIILDSNNYKTYVNPANIGVFSKAESKALHAANILDNSNFTNYVNQRGNGSTSGSWAYCIDRWIASASNGQSVWHDSNHIGIYGGSKIIQKIEGYNITAGKKYTLACQQSDGKISVASGTATAASSGSTVYSINGSMNSIGLQLYSVGDGYWYALISNQASSTTAYHLDWAALYEGEYTAETLPKYTAKGYGAELIQAMRYYQIGAEHTATISTDNGGHLVISDRLPIPMIANPTLTAELKAKKPADESYVVYSGTLTTTDPDIGMFKMYATGYTAKTTYIAKFKYWASCE